MQWQSLLAAVKALHLTRHGVWSMHVNAAQMCVDKRWFITKMLSQQHQPWLSSKRLAADLGYRVMTMHASPSSLQQPSMRHTRWQEAEASCSVCTSSQKEASAAAGAEPVCSLFTATYMAHANVSCPTKTLVRKGTLILRLKPGRPLLCASLAASLPDIE